ncbi:MAG: MFS transporter [Brevinema sp.]
MLNQKKSDSIRRYIQLGIVTLAAGGIYPIIYLRTNFQTPLLETFGMNISTLGSMYAILGVMNLAGYIPSGWLADRISSKLLLAFSLLLTGLVGLWYAQIPPVEHVRIIFLIWGISTVLTFWGSHMKIVKLLAERDEQGRFFGILDGGRGLVEAVLATIAVSVFSFVLSSNPSEGSLTRQALVTVIYGYAWLNIFLAGLIFLILEDKKDIIDQNNKMETLSTMEGIKKTLRLPEVWLISAIIFCGYTIFWTGYYIGGYLTTNHTINEISVGIVTVIILWMRPIGGIIGGVLADKYGRTVILGTSLFIGAFMLFALSFYTQWMNFYVVAGTAILLGLCFYFIRGLYWSLLDYCNLPPALTGFSIGIISFLGYTPDIFIPQWSGVIFNQFQDGPQAYSWYFIISGIFGLLGILFIFILYKRIKKSGRFVN